MIRANRLGVFAVIVIAATCHGAGAATPYFMSTSPKVGVGLCNDKLCMVRFPDIPAGQRLTILYASVVYKLTQSSTTTRAEVWSSNKDRAAAHALPPSQTTGGLTYVSASPVLAFVDGGQPPTVVIYGPNFSTEFSAIYVSLSGTIAPM